MFCRTIRCRGGFSAGVLAMVAFLVVPGAFGDASTKPVAREERPLELLWQAIGSDDPLTAHEAVGSMAAKGNAAVTFLRQRIDAALDGADYERLVRLIA